MDVLALRPSETVLGQGEPKLLASTEAPTWIQGHGGDTGGSFQEEVKSGFFAPSQKQA